MPIGWKDLSNAQRRWAVEQRDRGAEVTTIMDALGVDDNAENFARYLAHGVMWSHILKRRAHDLGMEGEAESEDEERQTVRNTEVLALLRKRSMSLVDLADALDCSPKAVLESIADLRRRGFCIEEVEGGLAIPSTPPPVELPKLPMWDGGAGVLRWAAASDLHAGSAAAQKTAFHRFMRVATERYAVRHTLVSGDLLAGTRMYRGQEFDLYASGCDAQVEDLSNDYLPYIDGHEYMVIGGNHDYSFYKTSGVDPLRLLAARRDDVRHCGWSSADVALTENCHVRMWHPSGGVPYALSYRGQKGAEQVAYQELATLAMEQPAPRVRVLQIGHLHVMGGPFSQGPIDVFQAGCFEGETSYLKEKGLVPTIGGYVFEAEVTEAGLIRQLTVHRLRFAPVEGDYRLRRPNPRGFRQEMARLFSFRELQTAPLF